MSRFGTQVIATIALSAFTFMLLGDEAEAGGGKDKKPKIGLPIKLFPGRPESPKKLDPAANKTVDAPARLRGAIARGTVNFISEDKRTFGVVFPKVEINVARGGVFPKVEIHQRFTLSDMHIINRGGNNSRNDLRVGDNVSFFDMFFEVAYVLVHEGRTKNSTLSHGTFNGFDRTMGQISLNFGEIDYPYAIGNVKTARLGMDNNTIRVEDIRIGEHVLVVSQPVNGTITMTDLLISRR